MSKIISKDVIVEKGIKHDIITDCGEAGYYTEVLEIQEPKKDYNKPYERGTKRSIQCVKTIQHNTKNLTAALKKHDQIVENFCKD